MQKGVREQSHDLELATQLWVGRQLQNLQPEEIASKLRSWVQARNHVRVKLHNFGFHQPNPQVIASNGYEQLTDDLPGGPLHCKFEQPHLYLWHQRQGHIPSQSEVRPNHQISIIERRMRAHQRCN